jgi:hypothetical protein
MGQTVEKSEGGATTVSQSGKPFTNFFLILGAVASLAIIPSATGAPPFFNIFYPNEETAIQPGSVISGYLFRRLILSRAMMRITVTWPTQPTEPIRWM